MKIRVTWSDIKKGSRKISESCALARAFRRAGFKRPEVMGTGNKVLHLAYVHKGQRLVEPLPKLLKTFAKRFDAGLPVEPFTFSFRPMARKVQP